MVHFVNSSTDYVYMQGHRGFDVRSSIRALIRGRGLTRYLTSFRVQLRGSGGGIGGTKGPRPGDRTVRIVIRDAEVASASWISIAGGLMLRGTLVFLGATPITSIDAADFQVLNSMGLPAFGFWTVSTDKAMVNAGAIITVTATPPTDTDGMFELRLRAKSVRSDNSQTLNAPENNVDSGLVSVKN